MYALCGRRSAKGGRAAIDPYKIPEVDYEATDSEIKKAYHALARKYHPDNFASDPKMGEIANRKMREINAAYEQLIADREDMIVVPTVMCRRS